MQNEFAETELTASLNSAQVARAQSFLESFSSSTLALRAIVAVMCGEHDSLDMATTLESVLEKIANQESEKA